MFFRYLNSCQSVITSQKYKSDQKMKLSHYSIDERHTDLHFIFLADISSCNAPA